MTVVQTETKLAEAKASLDAMEVMRPAAEEALEHAGRQRHESDLLVPSAWCSACWRLHTRSAYRSLFVQIIMSAAEKAGGRKLRRPGR